MKTLKTNQYDLFKKHSSNRITDRAHVKKMTAAIKTHNMLENYPIVVNKQMEVIDGQHRLEAAKILNIDVCYQIVDPVQAHDIILLNANQKKWSTEDYVNYYVSLGNEDFIKLKQFCIQHEVTIAYFTHAFNVFVGSRRENALKKGTYKFDAEKAEEFSLFIMAIKEIIKDLSNLMLKHQNVLKSQRFKEAIIFFVRNYQADLDILRSKLCGKVESIHPCSSIVAYVDMIKAIYNYRNQNPVGEK
jgi:hypothetical protein